MSSTNTTPTLLVSEIVGIQCTQKHLSAARTRTFDFILRHNGRFSYTHKFSHGIAYDNVDLQPIIEMLWGMSIDRKDLFINLTNFVNNIETQITTNSNVSKQ